MSAYSEFVYRTIIDYQPEERESFVNLDHYGTIHEPIVRCKDCVYKRNGWNGKRTTFSDWFFCAYCGGHELTNLNGFCSWGEKAVKDESDED